MRRYFSAPLMILAVLISQLAGYLAPAASAQEQSIAPTPAPVVLWWLEDAQTVINPSWQVCPRARGCQKIPGTQSQVERNVIMEEISRFSLSFDDQRRPILQYRFSGGGRLPAEQSQRP